MNYLQKIKVKRAIISILGYFNIYKFVKKFFSVFNFKISTRINSKKIIIPHIYGIALRINEFWMLDFLRKLFSLKKGSFIDIGVNIGQTLILVKALEPDRVYFGFEPNPSCNFYVQEIIKVNNFNKCTLIPVGLFNEDTFIFLDLYSDEITNPGASLINNFRIFRKNEYVHRSIVVPVSSFSSIRQRFDINSIGIIKIDVEGAELEVLDSITESIKEFKPLIIIEILPVYFNENKERLERQNSVNSIINNLGYNIFRIIKTDDNSFSHIEIIYNFGIHDNLEWCDYLLVPKDQTNSINDLFSRK